MKQIIDITTWERRKNYNFFLNYVNSWYSVTTEIDCTEAFAASKLTKRSFFLHYLYAILRSVNEIKEFRYRTDINGQVVLHDKIDVISPIAVPGSTFHSVRIPYCEDFESFYTKAHGLVTNIPDDSEPYGEVEAVMNQGDYDVMLLSAIPKMYFTSMTYTLAESGKGCIYPLMTVGKTVTRDKQLMFPFSIYVDHAFVDGAHISLLFQKTEEYLKIISKQ